MSEILRFFHCATCEGGNHAVGWTTKGLQVWCEQCDLNVIHLDLKGAKVDCT